MDLSRSRLLYLFLECCAVSDQRSVLADQLGLRLVEVERDEKHLHGIAKYDCGTILIALNKSPSRRFRLTSSDALVTVVRDGRGAPRMLTDGHGHHFEIDRSQAPGKAECGALKLTVGDIDQAIDFYQRRLGLPLLQSDARSARLQAGRVSILMSEGDRWIDGGRLRHDTYLLVFHTPSVSITRCCLKDRGVSFLGRGITSTPIGSTARFTDPSGHRLCLYQPSPASFAMPSGAALRRILDSAALPVDVP